MNANINVPFLPLAERMLDFVEKYRDHLPPGPDGRGPPWTKFTAWLMEQIDEDSKTLVAHLSKGIDTEDLAAVKQRIKIPSYGQCYKCVQVLQNPIGSSDTRLRDIFKLAMTQDSPVALPGAMFKARFFLSAFNRSKCPKPRTMELYNTQPATTFELLFFLVGICYLFPSSHRGRQLSAHPPKRRRTIVAPCHKKRECGQVLAYAIQSVIRAWDKLALALAFPNCEALTSPYIIFDSNTLTFKPIRRRDEGFAPLRQSRTLRDIGGPTRTQSACDQQAWHRDTQRDADLRSLARLFLDDIYCLIRDERIFEYESDNVHEKLQNFTHLVDIFSSTTPLSRRFQRLSKERLDRLRMKQKQEDSCDHDSNSPSNSNTTDPTVDAVRPTFPKFTQLPNYIIRFIAAFDHQIVPHALSEVPFCNWRDDQRSMITEIPLLSLAACEMSNLGLHVSGFPNYETAKVIASKTFCKGEDVGPLFGDIVYHDLGSPFQSAYSRLYADGEFSVSTTRFKEGAIKLSTLGEEFVTVHDEVATYWKNAWIVPCRFCICGYIRRLGGTSMSYSTEDDDDTAPDGKDRKESETSVGKEANVTIHRAEHSFSTISGITNPFAVRIVATGIIRAGDEIVLP